MEILLCKIHALPHYRGEDDCLESINFINFNGLYYGWFDGAGLSQLFEGQKVYDYVIFSDGNVAIGWYKNATVYATEQQMSYGTPYFVTCKDEDAFLMDERDRRFGLRTELPVQEIEPTRRILSLVSRTKRINYHMADLNTSASLNLSSVENTCRLIEQEMQNEHELNALKITNLALHTFGRLVALMYYKAWILYTFLQYDQALMLLNAIKGVDAYHDHVYFMLGNIHFECEEYEKAKDAFLEVKDLNKDQTAYLLAQTWAMLENGKEAMVWINQAITYNPYEEVYMDFKIKLEGWLKHE